jgi:hypothetical protein
MSSRPFFACSFPRTGHCFCLKTHWNQLQAGFLHCIRPKCVYLATGCMVRRVKTAAFQSHLTTDGLSVSPTWRRASAGTHDQVRAFCECCVLMCWAVRLKRERVRSCLDSLSLSGFPLIYIYTLVFCTHIRVFTLHTTYAMCTVRQSRPCAADHA